MPPAASDAQAALDYVHAALREHLLYESIGLFWLWAEVVILFAMREARHTLQHASPRPWKMRLLAWHGFFGVFAAAVLWRYYFTFSGPPWDQAIAPWYIEQTKWHLAVWSGFVLGWVVLESAIVFEGARAYSRFARLCRVAIPALALVAFTGLAGVAHAEAFFAGASDMQSLRDAEVELQVWRQGVYLYLRVAGIVWVAVEWLAAVLLWRGQGLLWRVARRWSSA